VFAQSERRGLSAVREQFGTIEEMQSALRSTRITLDMIKWEHSVFALPFALTGAVLAAGGLPSARVLLWIVVCMVSARSAAMAFNRLVDARLDAENPRTAMRALPAGLLSSTFVAGFVVVSAAMFFLGENGQLAPDQATVEFPFNLRELGAEEAPAAHGGPPIVMARICRRNPDRTTITVWTTRNRTSATAAK